MLVNKRGFVCWWPSHREGRDGPYLLYNSTISCSLIFSGTFSRSGYVINVPCFSVSLKSTHASFGLRPRIWLVTALLSFDFSFKPMISPGFSWKEGTFTTSPFTVTCL